MIRLIESGTSSREFKWSEGEALHQDLGSLTAGKFAERWVPDTELALLEG